MVPGLYTVFGVPDDRANELEDKFWRMIDQWGADCLEILESKDPASESKLVRERWVVFIMALLIRNPMRIKEINEEAKDHYANGFEMFREDYEKLKRAYEPETYDAFMKLFDGEGMSELGAQIVRYLSFNKPVIDYILSMQWHVVSLSNLTAPLLTSDNPLIRYKGLKRVDGLLVLPLNPYEFFVAFNIGEIDMKTWISDSIATGQFTKAMNKYVVERAITYVYGSDDKQKEFVERFLGAAPYEPLFEP